MILAKDIINEGFSAHRRNIANPYPIDPEPFHRVEVYSRNGELIDAFYVRTELDRYGLWNIGRSLAEMLDEDQDDQR